MHMEFSEYTRIVHNRISKIDPENVTKIIGFLLLCSQGDGEQEMVRLALGPDPYILEIVHQAKTELQLLALRAMSTPVSPPSLGGFVPFASPRNRHFPSPPLTYQQLTNKPAPDYMSLGYTDSMYELQNPSQYLDDLIEPPNSSLSGYDYGYADNAAMVNKLRTRIAARHYSAGTEFHPKICHYYNKGFCKHGSNCRYLHTNLISESFSQIYISNSINDDHVFRTGSLEKLEFEIVELLKSRRGNPISIASLPMIYYEKYGKVLQAEGYLTESQRHGKSGFSLTKLLIRLKRIQVIDRPHGQHAVILAEDASKFMDHRNEKNELGPIVSSARQIYMTFPADSTFTEDDVSVYFSDHYGLVEDVRIPCQQRRMFGFVTFSSIETVNLILSHNNEHIICGARVLVKPYREKSKLERRNQERIEQQHQTYYTSQYNNLESEQLHSIPRSYEAAGLRRLRIEEQQQQQQAFEVEKTVSEMNLMAKSIMNQTYFSYQMRELEEQCSSTVTERLDLMLDVLKNGSGTSAGLGIGSGLGLGLGSGSGSGSDSGSSNDDNKRSQNPIDWSHLVIDLEGFNLPESI